MNYRIALRFTAALTIALVCAFWSAAWIEQWHHRGRDAWVAYQLEQYDGYVPGLASMVMHTVGATTVWLFAFGAYEGASLLLAKLFSPRE